MESLAYLDGLNQQTMTQFSLLPLYKEVGQRAYPVARADLQQLLMQQFGLEDIRLGMKMTAIEAHQNDVTIHFQDGSQIIADLLIGADGTHSLTRQFVLGHQVERRYAGYVNWNGLVDIDDQIAPAMQWTTYIGEGKRVSLMPVAQNRFYFFFDVPLEAGLSNQREYYKQDLKMHFSGWCEPVQNSLSV